MDTISEPTIAPKPVKKVKRRKRSAKPKAEKMPAAKMEVNDEFGGLTAADCPYDCNADRCVISGMNVCGHPRKGGLQPAIQRDPEAMVRFNKARKHLAHQAVDKRA
jgi:hypothetical protein